MGGCAGAWGCVDAEVWMGRREVVGVSRVRVIFISSYVMVEMRYKMRREYVKNIRRLSRDGVRSR